MSVRTKPPQIYWPGPQRGISGSVQPRAAGADRMKPPAAPPVFWPHAGQGTAAKPVQPKAASQPPATQARTVQIPAVHWPHSAQKALQAKAAARPTPLSPHRPVPHSGVIQRSAELIEVEYTEHYECTEGHVVSFDETGGNEHFEEKCPLRCKGSLYGLKSKESEVYYCENSDCKQFHVSTLVSGNCLQCGKAKVQLSQKPAYVEVEVDEESYNKTERQLIALLKDAQSFVESSGSHHKSKGGRHTSSATEMHSSAHQSKKQVRDKYARGILELLESEQINDKKLIQKAKEMIGKVQNK